jgi:hypothetical protein
MGEKLVMHSRGPMVSAIQYNIYVVNGKLFLTIAHDMGKRFRTVACVCRLLTAKRTMGN